MPIVLGWSCRLRLCSSIYDRLSVFPCLSNAGSTAAVSASPPWVGVVLTTNSAKNLAGDQNGLFLNPCFFFRCCLVLMIQPSFLARRVGKRMADPGPSSDDKQAGEGSVVAINPQYGAAQVERMATAPYDPRADPAAVAGPTFPLDMCGGKLGVGKRGEL